MALDKHINFFGLQKAAEKPGCPLCRIVNDRAEWYIDNLLFEHVADRGFRALHRAAGGFCANHSRNLVSFRDGLAVAILSRDLLEDRITSFEKKISWHDSRRHWIKRSKQWNKKSHKRHKSRCPICIEREKIEEEYLSFLAGTSGNSPDERELRKCFMESDGLCIPHYSGLLFTQEGRYRGAPSWIRDFHEKNYRDLLARVSQFIEFSAYGRQKDFAALSEKDQLVWKEAAAALRGNL